MIGRGTLLWLGLAIVAGAGLFHVSYRVQSLEACDGAAPPS